MFSQPNPQYLILDIDYQAAEAIRELSEMIHDLIAAYAPDLLENPHFRPEYNFVQETIRQIFDFMTDDFAKFTLLLEEFPNFSRYPAIQRWAMHDTTYGDLREYCKQIAVALFFQMRDRGLFQTSQVPGFHFILSDSGPMHITLERVPEHRPGVLRY